MARQGTSSRLARALLAAALAAVAVAACGPPAPGDARAAREADARRAPARRVVSLAPAFTEILVALGAEDQVVGIGAYDPEVPGRPDVPRLGDAFSVSLESLVALEPDLVLVNARALAERLAPVAGRTSVEMLPTDRLADALHAIDEIAARTGREEAGRALRTRIESSVAAAQGRAAARRARGEPVPRVLVVVQRRPWYSAGGPAFVTDLLEAVGAQNVLGDLPEAWPSISEETILARAPDVVLDASVGDVETEAGRRALRRGWERFRALPAVRNGRVHVIREDALFRPGPRIPEALAALERLIHGEDGR